MALYNRTEMSGKYSQPLSISRTQQTVAMATMAHGMLFFFIILGLKQDRQRGWRDEGERGNVAWKIVCYEAILALELHTHTQTLFVSQTHTQKHRPSMHNVASVKRQ